MWSVPPVFPRNKQLCCIRRHSIVDSKENKMMPETKSGLRVHSFSRKITNIFCISGYFRVLRNGKFPFLRSARPSELLPDRRAGPLPGGGLVPGGLRRGAGGHLHPGALHRPGTVRLLSPVDCDQLSTNLQCLQSSSRHQVSQ